MYFVGLTSKLLEAFVIIAQKMGCVPICFFPPICFGDQVIFVWVEGSLREVSHFRDGKWTESVAVGSEAFVTATKEKLGLKAKGREVVGRDGSYELRESPAAYKVILGHENAVLRLQNEYCWDDIGCIST